MGGNQRLIPDGEADTREMILGILRQSPRDYQIQRTRWRLQDLLSVLYVKMDLGNMSLSTLHNWLYRLGITYRQGWEHITSPDPHLELKLSVIDHALELAQTRPNEVIVLWLDELNR